MKLSKTLKVYKLLKIIGFNDQQIEKLFDKYNNPKKRTNGHKT